MHIRSISKHLYALVVMIGLVMAILPANYAMAMISDDFMQKSHVTGLVSNPSGNTWVYTYAVYNDSTGTSGLMPVIVDWELPWLDDAGISSIISPAGWSYAIETIDTPNSNTGWDGVALWQTPGDPFYQAGSPFNAVTKVLHWYNNVWASTGQLDDNAIYPSADTLRRHTSLDGFGFTAIYGTTAAPYQASWASLPLQTGDPDFPLGLPNSPTLQGVPEPTTMLLLGLGLMGLAGIRRNLKG